MFKILLILTLIIFPAFGFTSQQNRPEHIPFIVFSSTAWLAKQRIALQGQKNMPKQALIKTEETILQPKISISSDNTKILTGIEELFTALNCIHKEIKKLEPCARESLFSNFDLTIRDLSIAIKTCRILINRGLFNDIPKSAAAKDLYSTLGSMTVVLNHFSALSLGIDFSYAIEMMDELHTQLIPILSVEDMQENLSQYNLRHYIHDKTPGPFD